MHPFLKRKHEHISALSDSPVLTQKGAQMAERLGNRAINQKVAGLIPSHGYLWM